LENQAGIQRKNYPPLAASIAHNTSNPTFGSALGLWRRWPQIQDMQLSHTNQRKAA
jgi:hypothetical protein